jgi:hypothetical protein
MNKDRIMEIKDKTILEYEMLLNIELAKNKELEQENARLREALEKAIDVATKITITGQDLYDELSATLREKSE